MKTRNPRHGITISENSSTRAIRTFLAEESPSLMAQIARALEKDARITIVGSAMVGPKTFCAASSLTPDLVVMDEYFGGVDAAHVTRHLKQLPNPPRVFVVSSEDRAESQSRTLAAGADAVLLNAPGLPQKIQAAVNIFFGRCRETEPHRRRIL